MRIPPPLFAYARSRKWVYSIPFLIVEENEHFTDVQKNCKNIII